MATAIGDYIKVHFTDGDVFEVSPFGGESCWAQVMDVNPIRARIDNLLFAVTGVTLDDIVSVDDDHEVYSLYENGGLYSVMAVLEDDRLESLKAVFGDALRVERAVDNILILAGTVKVYSAIVTLLDLWDIQWTPLKEPNA